MGKQNYFYPDTNDRITSFVISKRSSQDGSWERSEQRILNTIEECLKRSTRHWLLDAGCGNGRLLTRFERYFDYILAVDRDTSQIKKAKELVKSINLKDKVFFKTISAHNVIWPKESIDSIICSHLIQHVNTQIVSATIRKFRELSKEKGNLFLLTTHSPNHDYFTKEYIKNATLIEEKISQEEFNSLVENQNNILPIHYFSKKNIFNILAESGFRTIDFRLFHKVAIDDNKGSFFRDMLLVCDIYS